MKNDALISRNAIMAQLDKKRSTVAQQRYTEGFNDAIMRVRSMLHSATSAVVFCQDCVKRETHLCPMYREEYDPDDPNNEEEMTIFDGSDHNGFCHHALRKT